MRIAVATFALSLATITPINATELVLNVSPWFVYSDAGTAGNHGVWSNVMPALAANCIRIDLADRTAPFSGSTSIRLDIDLGSQSWCGLVVSSVDGGWGKTSDQPGFNLTGARRLVFHARGAVGGEGILVKAAVAGDQPYGDSAVLALSSGWIRLDKTWQRVEVPIPDVDLSRVITPFAVIVNRAHNPQGRLTIFFDDITYESER